MPKLPPRRKPVPDDFEARRLEKTRTIHPLQRKPQPAPDPDPPVSPVTNRRTSDDAGPTNEGA